ncbi:expressed protein [Echinococcus multilocularis]|uniref:Expressed protein n=1 Tax=Echinococcus multilocularis TaxID=6211 RepID=A0A087W2G0_ECHMU|nr:expressed protein [Echinococcus multilocularis]
MEETTEEKRPCCSTVERAFKCEFKCQKFGFSGANYRFFPFSQWMWMDGVFYPLYRFFVSIGLLVWACVEIPLEVKRSEEEHTKLYYFLYATNWAFLMYTISSNVFAVFCTYFNCKKEKPVPKWFAELLWFFYGMSMNTVLVTSLVYWAAFWDPKYTQFYRPESRLKHIVPACTVFVDTWVNGLPINIFHAIYPTLLGIIYAVFSYVYYDTSDVHPIYPVLNWSRPTEAISASVLAITFGIFIQLLLFLLYVGRITLSARLGGRGTTVVEEWWSKKSGQAATEPYIEMEAIDEEAK